MPVRVILRTPRRTRSTRGPLPALLVLGVAGLLVLAGCSRAGQDVAGEGGGAGATTSATTGRGKPWRITTLGDPDVIGDGATAAPVPVQPVQPVQPADPTTSAPPSPDVLAGVLSHDVPDAGDGELTMVPGTAEAPGPGDRVDLAISIEGGLDVDGSAFAGFVMDTVNDQRSWAHDGYTFARTDGDADVTIVLASPDTSARLCRPLQTNGTLSCRNGTRVIFTWYRWVNGQEDYASDPTGYRHYLVNHEVGHFLGHGHVGCPGPGKPAPVMMQQTKGLKGCAPNSWPYP